MRPRGRLLDTESLVGLGLNNRKQAPEAAAAMLEAVPFSVAEAAAAMLEAVPFSVATPELVEQLWVAPEAMLQQAQVDQL